MACAIRPAFGSSVGRSFGSPFSRYRRDYVAYPDEQWKTSLRKYPYPAAANFPSRRSRSASPGQRNVNTRDREKRRALEEIMAKLDNTQEDLQVLARKVAAWSREAALLSRGLKEEALLLELSRQADRLAVSEALDRELQKQERVYRLSEENNELRGELRQFVSICKLLLDRPTSNDASGMWISEAASPRQWRSRTPPRWARWYADDGYGSDQRLSRRVGVYCSDIMPAGASPLSSRRTSRPVSSSGHSSFFTRPYETAVTKASVGCGRRRLSYSGSYDTARMAYEMEGLTDSNAAYVVVADRAQADVEADPHRLAARQGAASQAAATAAAPALVAAAPAAAAPAIAAASGSPRTPAARARIGGGHYEEQVTDRDSMFKRTLDRERRQVDAALAAVDDALEELTLKVQRRSGSGGGSRVSGGGNRGSSSGAVTVPRAESLVSAPTFGDHARHEKAASAVGARAAPQDERQLQRRQDQARQRKEKEHQTEVERVEKELLEADKELEKAVGEEAVAAAAAEAEAAAAKAAAAQAATKQAATAAAAAAFAAAENAEGRDEEPVIGTPVGMPLKFAPAPVTPVYKGVPYGNGGGAPSTVRYDAAHTLYRRPKALDSVLQTEVEKLKMINKTLARTLQSYNRVVDHLGDTTTGGVAVSSPTTGTGSSRAAFSSHYTTATATSGSGSDNGVDLAALPSRSPGPHPLRNASVAVACGGSSASTVLGLTSSAYAASYSLGGLVRAAAALPPSVPAQAARHPRSEEFRVSWAPSAVPRAPPHSSSGGSALVCEAGGLESALDGQLYGIRGQVQALRNDMVTETLAALTSSPRAGATAAALPLSQAVTILRPLTSGSGVRAFDDAAAPLNRGKSKLERLQDEVSELRRQARDDRRWYENNLELAIAERTATLGDLQRRIERLSKLAI